MEGHSSFFLVRGTVHSLNLGNTGTVCPGKTAEGAPVTEKRVW